MSDMTQGTIWNILGMLYLTPWMQDFFIFWFGVVSNITKTAGRICWTWHREQLPRLSNAWLDFFMLFKLGAAEVCALGVLFVLHWVFHYGVIANNFTHIFSQYIPFAATKRIPNYPCIKTFYQHPYRHVVCGIILYYYFLFHILIFSLSNIKAHKQNIT